MPVSVPTDTLSGSQRWEKLHENFWLWLCPLPFLGLWGQGSSSPSQLPHLQIWLPTSISNFSRFWFSSLPFPCVFLLSENMLSCPVLLCWPHLRSPICRHYPAWIVILSSGNLFHCRLEIIMDREMVQCWSGEVPGSISSYRCSSSLRISDTLFGLHGFQVGTWYTDITCRQK